MTTVKTKIYLEVEVEVNGDYVRATHGSWYSNGGVGEPPEPAEFIISSVNWNGLDITKNLDKDNYDFGALEEKCLESIENE